MCMMHDAGGKPPFSTRLFPTYIRLCSVSVRPSVRLRVQRINHLINQSFKLYCAGETNGNGGSSASIAGGTFTENEALLMGGVASVAGSPTVLTITGGLFRNNSARRVPPSLFGSAALLLVFVLLKCHPPKISTGQVLFNLALGS